MLCCIVPMRALHAPSRRNFGSAVVLRTAAALQRWRHSQCNRQSNPTALLHLPRRRLGFYLGGAVLQAQSGSGSRRDRQMETKPAQNIQDTFLNTARKDKSPITIYLMSGVK